MGRIIGLVAALGLLGCGSKPEPDTKASEPVAQKTQKPAPVSRAEQPDAAPAATESKGKDPGPAPGGISQVSDSKWQVTQALVDRWTATPDQLGRVREDGRGWALMNSRQRDAYHLGMRNGDIIVEVNGHQLDTQLQLLGAWMDLKNDSKFDVVFLRDGQRLTYHYVVK